MTAGGNTNPDYWEYGFEVFNVYCWGQKTDLQVMHDHANEEDNSMIIITIDR